MGIRFACPNGHRLHVKAYLAGQRGVCPECGVRVQIPSGNGSSAPLANSPDSVAVSDAAKSVSSILQQAPLAQGQGRGALVRDEKRKQAPTDVSLVGQVRGAATSDSIVIRTEPLSKPKPDPAVSKPPPTKPPSIKSATADTAPDPPPSSTKTWHVRPPGGGQYGPADTQTFTQWVHEKRVVPESYVWCEGWSEWQRAGDIADQLPGLLGQFRTGDAPGEEASAPVVDTSGDKQAMESPAIKALKKSRRRSQRFQIALVVILLVAVVALLGVLVRVMTYQPPPKSHRGGVVQTDYLTPPMSERRVLRKGLG